MVNELQEKFFCPRLIDYIVVVGSYSPLSKHSIPNADYQSNRPQSHQQKSETSSFNRSASVSSSIKGRPTRGSKSSKKTPLYSVGRALTCSSFSISNSSVSRIQVKFYNHLIIMCVLSKNYKYINSDILIEKNWERA